MAICQGSRIKTLHLGGNKFGPTTIQTICKNIQGMTCIQSLGLRNSQIETEDQLNAVGALLAHVSCGIHDLQLRKNNLRNCFDAFCAKQPGANRTLRVLELQDTKLTAQQLSALAAWLQ